MTSEIARIWRGWGSGQNADAFERMLVDRILPEIEQSGLAGLTSMTLLRRVGSDEVQYLTILTFETLDAIRAFAGDDAERAHLDPGGVKLLSKYDERARHYEILERISLVPEVERRVP